MCWVGQNGSRIDFLAKEGSGVGIEVLRVRRIRNNHS